MNKYSPLALVMIMCFAGCAADKATHYEVRMAANHMRMADSLLKKSAIRKAAHEYTIVAEEYPNTTYYPEAVYNSAVLYSSPLNKTPDDSASLHWFRVYLTLPISDKDKEKANTYISMLERIVQLRRELAHRAMLSDSLSAIIEKLRAIDVDIYKRGVKK